MNDGYLRPVPAWLALNRMADAVTDDRWGKYDPLDGSTEEQWCEAKEGDFAATRDDMVEALFALADMGAIVVDWDAEPPEPRIVTSPSGYDEET